MVRGVLVGRPGFCQSPDGPKSLISQTSLDAVWDSVFIQEAAQRLAEPGAESGIVQRDLLRRRGQVRLRFWHCAGRAGGFEKNKWFRRVYATWAKMATDRWHFGVANYNNNASLTRLYLARDIASNVEVHCKVRFKGTFKVGVKRISMYIFRCISRYI